MNEAGTCCPLCNNPSRFWLNKNGYPLRECTHCGHRFYVPACADSHLQSVYGDHYFSNSSEGYVDYLSEEEIQRASARHYYNRLKKRVPPTARVLDVGAACGFFLKEFQDRGWQCLGLEPNATMRAVGWQRFEVRIIGCSIAELPESEKFELITAIQLISHLLDPAEFATEAHARLAPTGHLLVETWDRRSLVARLFRTKWHELNPPSVLHWFSRTSLQQLICDAGFELVDSGLPRKRIQLGRALRMLRHSCNHSTMTRFFTWPLALMPKQLSLPYLLGDAFWMLFQKRS